jgi:outer membrane protein, heavy metal efflux system
MRRLWSCLIVSFVLAAPLRALTEEADPVLAALVERALAHSPELAAARASADAAGRRPGQERALPAPTLSVLYTNDGVRPTLGQRDMTTLAFMASQEISGAGTRALRANVLERAAEEARLGVERRRLDLVAGVIGAYHERQLAEELLELAREQEALWQEIEASARARYASGLGTQVEVLRAQVEVTRSGEQILVREADVSIRRAELNRRVGRPLDEIAETVPRLTLRPLGREAADVLRQAEQESPERRAAEVAVDARGLGVALARRALRPGLTLQAGYMNRAGLDPMWQAGVGVSWPLFTRGREQAGLAAAVDEESAGRREQEAVRADLELRTRQRLARLASLARVGQLYEHGLLPQGRLALEAALAQYRAGRSALVTVLDALNALTQDRASSLRQIAAHETLKARLFSWSLAPDEGLSTNDGMAAARTAMGPSPSGSSATSTGSRPPPAASGGMPGMGEGR